MADGAAPGKRTASGAPTQAPAAAATPPSPCINVCRMQAHNGLCEGCLRTLDEIAAWSQMSDDHKRAVWATLERRRAQQAARTAQTVQTAQAAQAAKAGEGAP